MLTHRPLSLSLLFTLLSMFVAACVPAEESINVKILPLDCTVAASGQLALSLVGHIPAGMQINWSSTAGNVVWAGQGLVATFIAPKQPGAVTINVVFISGTPSPFSASRECIVTSGDSTDGSLAGTAGADPGSTSPDASVTVAISEVMANVCGGPNYKPYNQYIELYNYGSQPQDVNGWFFFDEGKTGTPDMLVAWAARSSFALDPGLVVNSTIIPPHGFALILSPQYPDGLKPYHMPYAIPAGTIILTIATSNTLGDDTFGIIAADNGSDTITLYRGSYTVMDQVIDTYGTPSIKGPYPNDNYINDDFNDHDPIYTSMCSSAERVDPAQKDSAENWVSVFGGTPGDGPYH